MLRTGVVKLGAGAAAAGAASGQLARSAQGDVRHSNHPALARASIPEASDRQRQLEEEAWLEVSLNDEDVVFDKVEVQQTVEEIVGLVPSDGDTSDGSKADTAIDTDNARSRTTVLEDVFRASQRLVGHPGVQSAALAAIRDDEQLRAMIQQLSECHVGLTGEGSESAIVPFDVNASGSEGQRRRGQNDGNMLRTLFEDLCCQLGQLASAIKDAVGKLAQMVKRALMWIWNSVKEAVAMIADAAGNVNKAAIHMLPIGAKLVYELGPVGRAAPVVLAGAMVLIVVMIMKRSLANA